MVLVAQSVAYSALAGVPPTTGLYAALVAPVLYALIGRSDVLSAGPTAISSLLVGQALAEVDGGVTVVVAHAALLAAMVGGVQLLAAGLRLHRVARWITPTVLRGFLAGAALRIVWTQAPILVGWSEGAPDRATAMVGLAALALLFVPLPEKAKAFAAIRTVVVMALFTLLSFLFVWPVAQVGHIPSGLPTPALPWLGEAITTSSLVLLAPSAVLIGLFSFVEGIGAAAAREQDLRPSRELIGLAVANLGSSLVRGYPVSGGLSRTAVNANAGATSRLAGALASVVVVLVLLVGSAVLGPLPDAVLAAVVTAGVLSLIDLKGAKASDRRQRWVLAITFVVTLVVGVGPGIVTGAIADAASRWKARRDEDPVERDRHDA